MRRLHAVALLAALAAPAVAAPDRKIVAADVRFALDELEKQCRDLLRGKRVPWGKVRREFLARARKVESLQDHYELLVRLVARLRDGHAAVVAAAGSRNVAWPGPDLSAGPALFLCRSGRHVLVKTAWGNAAAAGLTPGMRIEKIDGIPAGRWLDERADQLGETTGFSTPQQAFFYACHWGLGGPAGSTLSLQSGARTFAVERAAASTIATGPVFPPEGVTRLDRQSYGRTKAGWGYIHLRDIPRDMLAQLDTMLAALEDVNGLILDFRANGGGGMDHDAFLGRFVPAGSKLARSKAYPIESAGAHPFGGPVVVIVDAGVRSAGETASGMFKEDGRGYMIGETPTAGMSSSKVTIELPSKLFSLYVSVHSNKARFQGGRGIEGIGIEPHEIVEYDEKDLAAGVDTLIARAEALLADFPQGKVAYRPEQHGWKR